MHSLTHHALAPVARCSLRPETHEARQIGDYPAATRSVWTSAVRADEPAYQASSQRHCRTAKKRILRNGLLALAAAIIASLVFTEASFRLVNGNDYAGSMLAAVIIPMVITIPVYRWIAALALRLERSNAALDRLAHTDPLTGIANRRAAMEMLHEWTSNSGAVRGCAIAIADIDDFKCINDSFGHSTGDAALNHVAAMLERMADDGWLVARIGGEEFLIAAQQTATAPFAARIEALRAALAAAQLITPAGPYPITASFGLAQWQPNEPAERLLSRADRALYRAKQTGRNRVEQAA